MQGIANNSWADPAANKEKAIAHLPFWAFFSFSAWLGPLNSSFLATDQKKSLLSAIYPLIYIADQIFPD
jgi:hypothetical protein